MPGEFDFSFDESFAIGAAEDATVGWWDLGYWPRDFWDMRYWFEGEDGNWLLIPDNLNWIGVWDAATTYALDDVVLYNDGVMQHAFVSKQRHNTGNIPTTEYPWWTRLVQERWNE